MSRFKGLWLFLIFAVFAALLIFPLYILFKMSVSAPSEIFSDNPPYLIHSFTLSHFQEVFRSGSSLFAPFKKSLITALLASAFALIISIPAAYAISKFNYRIRYALTLAIFMTRMMPEVSIALPVAVGFIKIGLFDTVLGLTLAHLIRILPISCFILVGVFSAFPAELEKQARIDGCSRTKALIKVVLPLSLGGISVAGIFSFLLSWDEFIYASYLSLAEPTMPLKMYYYVSRGDIFNCATYAVIITAPVLLITFFLQRFIKPGYLSGAIKG
ncbi:carbohydrate ABC transporter permease [Candidatus Omnitrophota bacterium]